jgi:arylsulfatase A-like enzyme
MADYPSGEPFGGVIGRTIPESTPWWPPPKQTGSAPNIVLVVLDDTGFAHLGCYGSSIETPNIDALAAGGLRFTGFHTTALCSPTRACLLTGRNHHAVGMRAIANFSTGYPNMRGAIPKSAATVAELVREAGYATFAAGKWHVAPMGECSPAGPFHNWPLQKGFERYYGFLNGETDQFFPELTHDNHFVDPPGGPEDGYHVSEDITDRSIGFIRDLKSLVPERPFFLYLAYGAMHSPHQAPESYRLKYRGRFDEGWDVARERWFARQKAMGLVPPNTQLAPHNPGVMPWTSLGADERRFAARLMEVFAAMLDHTDAQIGRLVRFLDDLGQLDNTLFMVLSDNGASGEGGALGVLDEMKAFNGLAEDLTEGIRRLDDIGGPDSHCNVPMGWAQAGNTPLKWYKAHTYGGGIRDPLVVSWPARLGAPGEMRRQFCHAVDIAPTILEAAGVAAPDVFAGVAQQPVRGVSLIPALADRNARLGRKAQYFEMHGKRGLWSEGWKAVTNHRSGDEFDTERWALYHLDEDFSECVDLAEQEPERLKALVAQWWEEAEANGVFPIDDRPGLELFRASVRPDLPTSRSRFVYYPPISHIIGDACPTTARGWTTTIEFDHPEGEGDGALVARGSANSGYAIFVKGGRVVFDYNDFHSHTRVEAAEPLRAGPHLVDVVVARVGRDAPVAVTLSIDGVVQGRGAIPRLTVLLSATGLDFGRSLSPVTGDYAAPFTYPGVIHRVVMQLPETPTQGEAEAKLRAEEARQ